MVGQALEYVSAGLAGKVKLVKVNVGDAPGVSQRCSVLGTPTLVILENGELLASRTGAAPQPALRDWLTHVIDRDHAASGR